LFLSNGLRAILELAFHSAMRDLDTKDDWIFKSGDAPPRAPKPVCEFAGQAVEPAPNAGGIIRITVKSDGFVPVKLRTLERNHTRVSGAKGEGQVCLEFQSSDGCPHANCSKDHIHTLLTPEQYLYCLGRGGLRGRQLREEELRCALPEIMGPEEDQRALIRRFLGTCRMSLSRVERSSIPSQ
jgi:hypothetical protein